MLAAVTEISRPAGSKSSCCADTATCTSTVHLHWLPKSQQNRADVPKMLTAAACQPCRLISSGVAKRQHTRDTTAGTAAASAAALHAARASCCKALVPRELNHAITDTPVLSRGHAAVLTRRQPLDCCSRGHSCRPPNTQPGQVMIYKLLSDVLPALQAMLYFPTHQVVCETLAFCSKGNVTTASSR